MKKYTLVLFTTFLLICGSCQDFVGKDAKLYLNAIVRPKEIDEYQQKYAYKNFYLQFDTTTKVLTKKPIDKKGVHFKPFQVGESYSPKSDYSKLVGVEFKVIGVYEKAPEFDFDSGTHFVLALKNENLGIIYYEYDTRYKHDLEITLVSGLNYPDNYWCNKFTISKDKFEDKISYFSPQTSGVTVIKVVSKNISKYYLSIEEYGETANVDGKGLYLLFDDGSKIIRENVDIDVNVGRNGGFLYSAIIELSSDELNLLKSNKLTDNRLYIYDGKVDNESANLIQEYIKCILSN
jgi:hypothetical protein